MSQPPYSPAHQHAYETTLVSKFLNYLFTLIKMSILTNLQRVFG